MIFMETSQFGPVLQAIWRFSPVLFGAAGGYLLYRFVGCKTGTCPITRNPWVSMIYGAVLGAMLVR